MALDPKTRYPGQVSTLDPGYPNGKAQNIVVVNDGTGTPWEQDLVNDFLGFEQALLDAARITPTNTPDKVGASQYLDALRDACRREIQKKQAINWPERGSFHDAGDLVTPDGPVDIAWAPTLGVSLGGRYVVISPSNTSGFRPWSSEDGTEWDHSGLNNAAYQCVAYGKINGAPGFLMTWAAPTGYYTSVDGLAWGPLSATVPAHAVACWAESLSLWVLAGDAGVIYTSPTGLAGSWTVRTTPGAWVSGCGGARRIVWNGSLFVILPLGSYSKCLTSPDGINWTERALGGSGLWVGVAYSSYDGLWMAIGNGLGYSTSPDGLTWTLTPGPPAANDLAVIGPLWVMVTQSASFGGIAYSTNKGASWSTVAVGNHRVATAGWNRIVVADGRFVVAHATGAQTEIALSVRA